MIELLCAEALAILDSLCAGALVRLLCAGALAEVELLCAGALAGVDSLCAGSLARLLCAGALAEDGSLCAGALAGAGRLRSDLVSLARVLEVLVDVALGPDSAELILISVLLCLGLRMLRKVPRLVVTIAEAGNIFFFATVLNSNLLALSLFFFSLSITLSAADLASRRPRLLEGRLISFFGFRVAS